MVIESDCRTVIIILAIVGVLSVLLTSYFHLPLLQIYN